MELSFLHLELASASSYVFWLLLKHMPANKISPHAFWICLTYIQLQNIFKRNACTVLTTNINLCLVALMIYES